MNVIYRILASVAVVVLFLLLIFKYAVWHGVTVVYIIASNLFVWTTLTLWCLADIKTHKSQFDFQEKFTVMTSIFNEDPKRIFKVLAAALEAEGEKELIVGDDGSEQPIGDIIKKIKNAFPAAEIKLIRSQNNIGKKKMQSRMIRAARYNYIINMDSDVIVEKKAFVQLLQPLKKPDIGITNARIIMLGDRKRILHRIQGVLYFCANQVGRKSTGNLGIMPCASGELLAFRKNDFMDVLDRYENAQFLRAQIGFGEDRRMTNLLLEKGFKSVYVESARAYTFPKQTVRGYIKQQLRWRRSWIRETLYAWRFAWKKPLLLYEITLILMLSLTFSFLTFLIITFSIITLNPLPFLAFFIIIIITTVLRNIPYLFEHKFRSGDLILYAAFNFLFIMPLWIYALVTMDAVGWGNRQNGKRKIIKLWHSLTGKITKTKFVALYD